MYLDVATLIANNLQRIEKNTTKSLQRLSSGRKVNSASDDAAGLAISSKLKAQINGYTQAADNIQNGVSLAQTADGALANINTPPLQRLRELAVKAANGDLTASDRQAIQREVDQIKDQIGHVISDSEYNTIKIFDGRTLQNPVPGPIVGNTIILPYGLDVVDSQNRTLTFKLDGVQHSISLDTGHQDPAALLADINAKLQAAGTDVTASYQGRSLVFNSPTKVMDSFGGDMMELNQPYTSVLYDMAQYGYQFGAYADGSAYIGGGATIAAGVNDTFTFQLNGSPVTIAVAAGTYDSAGLVQAVNDGLAAAGADATAFNVGNYLRLSTNASTPGVSLTNISGPAVGTLFTAPISYPPNIYSAQATQSSIVGTKTLSGMTAITAGVNDNLQVSVDGTDYNVTLASGSYDVNGLVTELNNKLAAAGAPLTAGSSGGELTLTHQQIGFHDLGQVQGTAASLFEGSAAPTAVAGTNYQVEGVSQPQPGTSAYIIGNTTLAGGATITTGVNDTFKLAVDGVMHTVQFAAGTYDFSGLVNEFNNKLSSLGVSATAYGNQIELQRTAPGGPPDYPYSLGNFSGNAFNAFFSTLTPNLSYGSNSPAYVIGMADLSGGLNVTSGVNDQLDLTIDGTNYSLTLAAGNYNSSGIAAELNSQLAAAGAPLAASYLGGDLMLTGGAGVQNITSVSGNAANDLLYYHSSTYVNYYNPANQTPYIVGELNLGGGADIHQGENDTLNFTLTDNGSARDVSITLDAGQYTAVGLLNEINTKLSGTNVTASYNPSGHLELSYDQPNVGFYSIDQVGGNASYTLFYPGPKSQNVVRVGPELQLQVGPNTGNTMATGLRIPMTLDSLGIRDLDLTSQNSAEQAISTIDAAIDMVSGQRSQIGALQNALTWRWNYVTQAGQNLIAADSRITDADMAQEMASQAKAQILIQLNAALAAQANQQNAMVLKLLD